MNHPLLSAGTAVVSKDDWHAVTDTKKRKQIQDRLAQRARRKYSPLSTRVTEISDGISWPVSPSTKEDLPPSLLSSPERTESA